MKTAYLYQLVNLVASSLLLVAVVAFLKPAQYLQWILFTNVGGLLIQAETSLNSIATRHISFYAASGGGPLRIAINQVRATYRRFAVVGSALMLLGGGTYFLAIGDGHLETVWPWEWLTYSLAFAAYYWQAGNTCTLIAMQQARDFALIGIVIRVSNVFGSIAAMAVGMGVPGLVASVGVSFLLGAGLYSRRARRERQRIIGSDEGLFRPPYFHPTTAARHALYALAAYILYRTGLFVDAALGKAIERQANYGLALQIFALIMTLAIVPLTMRVTPLVAAIQAGDRRETSREIATLAAYVNISFVAAVAALVIVAPTLLAFLPRKGAALPSTLPLLAIGGAFFVEINIMILVNIMIAARRFAFTLPYLRSMLVALACGIGCRLAGLEFYLSFVVVPTIVQIIFAGRALARLQYTVTGVGFGKLAVETGRHVVRIARHPIHEILALR